MNGIVVVVGGIEKAADLLAARTDVSWVLIQAGAEIGRKT